MTQTDSTLVARLAESELFAGVGRGPLADIAKRARVRSIPKGEQIFLQGEPALHAHLLIEGSVKIVQSGKTGEQIIVRLIRPGETFGTVAMYTDGRYPADAVANLDSVEARWSRTVFQEITSKSPQVSSNVIRLMAFRLQEVQRRLREISTEPVEQRLANILLRTCKAAGCMSNNHGFLLLSRRDVAELAGTTVYTASRILKAWQRQKIIESGRGRLSIQNRNALISIGRGQP